MKNRKGSTLVMTLMIFAVLMIFGTFILSFMVTENKQSLNHQYKTQAYYIARSGAVAVEAAIMDMQDDKDKLDKLLNSLPLKIDISEFNFINGDLDELNLKKEDNNFVIESIGTVNEISQDINLYIPYKEVQGMDSIDMAIFSLGSIEFESQTQEHLIGPIGTNAEGGGQIKYGNNGFKGGMIVNIPIDYKDDYSTIFDEKSTNDSNKPIVEFINKRNYPMPIFPEYPNNLPPIGKIITDENKNKNPEIKSSSSYTTINITNNGHSLTIDTSSGDVSIVVDNLIVSGSIKVTGDNIARIYTKGFTFTGPSINNDKGIANNKIEIYYDNNETFNVSGDSKLNGSIFIKNADVTVGGSGYISGSIVSGGSSIEINGAGLITNGLIYVPNSNVTLGGSGSINGALVGKNVTLKGESRVYLNKNYLENIKIPTDDSDGNNVILNSGSYFK